MKLLKNSIKYVIIKKKNESNLFYCSIIEKPKKDEYIEEKYCNVESKFPSIIFWILFLLNFLQILHHRLFKNLYKDLSIKFHNIGVEFR